MESLFVDEKVGIGGEADVEKRKERAQLCVAMGSIPRDGEETKSVGWKTTLEKQLGGLEVRTIEMEEHHVGFHISSGKLVVKHLEDAEIAVFHTTDAIKSFHFQDVV